MSWWFYWLEYSLEHGLRKHRVEIAFIARQKIKSTSQIWFVPSLGVRSPCPGINELMPCPFTGPKMFCGGPNFLCQPKNLVPLQNLLCKHKKQFYWMQIIFLSGTKWLWLPQYVNNFLVWHKKFGPAQNFLGPVKGQGITGPNFFCAGPNFLSQPKNLTAFIASSKTFVPAQKPILLNANHLFVWHKMFVTDTICK